MCRSKQLCSGGDPQKWGLHRLQVLKMDSCPLMTDVDLYHAVAALPELRCLSVQGDPCLDSPSQISRAGGSCSDVLLQAVSAPYLSSLP